MGEARRKASLSCPCGSGRPSKDCCFTRTGWRKQPAYIDLQKGASGKHPACYLNALQTCSDKISREHLVSEAVLKVINKSAVGVAGLPWMGSNETRLIGLSALTGKCLCTRHNNSLSLLDTAAAGFFDALMNCDLQKTGGSRFYLFSGHDIERWLLKTVAALAKSGNLAHGGARLVGEFHPTVQLADLLQTPDAWRKPLGLYFIQQPGERFTRADHFEGAPLTTKDGKIAGWICSIEGFRFVMFATVAEAVGPILPNAVYRPGRFVVNNCGLRHVVQLSWEDNIDHIDITMSANGGQPSQR